MPFQASAESPRAELLSQELVLSSLVHEVTRVLLSAAQMDQAHNTFLLGVAELTGMQRLLLLAPRGKRKKLAPEHSLGIPSHTLKGFQVPPAHAAMAHCLEENRYQWVEMPAAGDPFAALGCKQYLLMPVTVPKRSSRGMGRECIAVLWLDGSALPSPPTVQALAHLAGLCDQAGLVLENFRIRSELGQAYSGVKRTNADLKKAHAELQAAQRRIHADLERAHGLQNALLPRTIPSHLLRDFASRYIPAGQVGGDYYDCFEAAPGKLALVVADVSGHGTAAALIMTMFKVLLKTLMPSSAGGGSPAKVLERINQTFLEDLDGRHFVTVFLGLFDKETRVLTYSSAGHIPQLLLYPGPDGKVFCLTELCSHGLVVGMFPDVRLSESRVDVGENARLVLYTDGISEAHGSKSMFGMERLREMALNSMGESAEALGSKVMQALADFRAEAGPTPEGGEDLSDDATLVILDL